MFFALGAASSAIDALKALTSSKSSAQTTGAGQNATGLFNLPSSNASASIGPGAGSGGAGGASISPETMSALLDAQSQSGSNVSSLSMRSNSLKDWFAKVDSDGDGKISKSAFEALGSGGDNAGKADSVFGKLDADGDGSVSLKELACDRSVSGRETRPTLGWTLSARTVRSLARSCARAGAAPAPAGPASDRKSVV